MIGLWLMSQGVSPGDFQPGDHAVAYMFAPGSSWLPFAALLPLDPDSKTMNKIRQGVETEHVAPLGKGTLIAADANTLTKATEASGALTAIAGAPLPVDLQIFANVNAIMAAYKDDMEQKLKEIEALLAKAPALNAEMQGRMQRIFATEGRMALDLLEQSRSVTIGVDAPPEALELSSIVQAQPGSGLDKVYRRGPVTAPDLTVFLQPGAMVRMQQSYRDLRGLGELELKYIALMLGPGHEAGVEKLRADFKDLDKIGWITAATAMGLSAQGRLFYEAVAVSGDNKELVRLVNEKLTDWMNAGPFHDLYRELGIDISVKPGRTQRKLYRWPVYRYDFKVALREGMPQEQREQLEKMLGGAYFEMMRMGRLVLFSLGEPIDALAERALKEPQSPPLAAMQKYPAGGVYYFDINIAGIMEYIRRLAPQEDAGILPAPEAEAPPISGCGYHADGMGYYRMRVPRELILSMKGGAGPKPEKKVPATPASVSAR